jgi:hypothetical protein
MIGRIGTQRSRINRGAVRVLRSSLTKGAACAGGGGPQSSQVQPETGPEREAVVPN